MGTGLSPIDVWNIDTFDDELRGDLDVHAALIRGYFLTSKRQWLEGEASDHTMPFPENAHAGEFMWVTEHIMRLMEVRSIRAWHYSRMSDAEVDLLRDNGIYLSTVDTIRARLTAQVAAGAFAQDIADRLFNDSPFQSEQLGARSNKFWMVSHPTCIEDSGVELLLKSWGEESAYFWQQDLDLQALLMGIGRPRILELAIPLLHSRHSYSAAEAVVEADGRGLGCRPARKAFDLYTHQPLGSEHLLAVHSEGDETYMAMARGYPAGYVKGEYFEELEE